MGTILQNKSKFLVLVFLAVFLSAYSAPGPKPKYSKSAKKEYRHEYKNLKGVCNCYKDRNNKQKITRPSAKYLAYQRRNHFPNK